MLNVSAHIAVWQMCEGVCHDFRKAFDNSINLLGGRSEPASKTLTTQVNKPSIDGQVRVSRKTRSLEVKIRIRLGKDQADESRILPFSLCKRFVIHMVGPKFPERGCFLNVRARDVLAHEDTERAMFTLWHDSHDRGHILFIVLVRTRE